MANDDLFFSEARRGHEHALKVGARLLAAGLFVQVNPLTFRSDVSRRHDYKDEIDVFAMPAAGSLPVPLEVKSRNLKFTSRDDYRYPTVFVDTRSGWDRKAVKPKAVVVVSQQTGAALVVPAKTQKDWHVVAKHDHVRGINDEWYECPLALTRTFAELVDWLRGS